MSASLVGSEMCIRDRSASSAALVSETLTRGPNFPCLLRLGGGCRLLSSSCLLYTSDAADDM
eukprot:9737330-Alexandrium_andersonii.AAC.1